MILLVDMDGPLADFDAWFFAKCAVNGWTMDCGPAEQRHRFATDHMPKRAERRAARAMVEAPGWFRDLPVVPGAIAGMDALAEWFDVWICTKPLTASPTCVGEKTAWILRHFGGDWLDRLIISPDKSMIRGDLLLDDAPKIEWAAVAAWRPVIFPAGFNGRGSVWQEFPRWSWDDPVETLWEICCASV